MIQEKETFTLRGLAYEVHKQMGCGFLEKVYQDAYEIELKEAGIPYEREKRIKIMYKGHEIDHEYIADFICYGNIIVELKATHSLDDVFRAQVYNYLKATNYDIGLLVNFGEKSCKIERLFNHNKNL